MMRNDDKTCIFKYNKINDLVEYLELDNDKKLKCYYRIDNHNTLKRIYNNSEEDDDGNVTIEHKKAMIVFEENCGLSHIFLDGDSCVRAIKSGSSNRIFPIEKERIESTNGCPDKYKINPSLSEQWFSKVNTSENVPLLAKTS